MKKIFYNGNIITMKDERPQASAMVVENGIICAVGDENLLDLYEEETEKIDLQGKTLLPSFIESHMHVLSLGMFLRDVNLQNADGIASVIQRGKEYIQKNEPEKDEWIRGRGWNQDKFKDENRFLTRYDLDRISTKHPIAFTRTCGHVIAVNSRALEILGMEEQAPVVEGGRIDTDEKGVPIGIFREKARKIVLDAIPELSKEEIKELIRLTAEEALSHGITTIHSDDFKDVPNNFRKVIDAYRELEDAGEMNMKVYEQCNLPSVEKIKEFLNCGYGTGYGTPKFRLGPLKLLADGSLGSRTAYLRKPYSDDGKTMGISLFSQEELTAMITEAHKAGMQVAIHAIGDGAMEMVLNAIEAARRQYPRDGERHGIIHCQITSPEQIDRMKKMDLIAYIQPIFLNYDITIVEDRIGKERAKTSYCWKTIIDKGIHACGGSDCPVESLNIMHNIYTAVCRKRLNGEPEGGWNSEENLSVMEALKLFTTKGAYASFEEKTKGKIAEGYAADFVIINEDILNADAETIKDIKIQETYMDGELKYKRECSLCY